MMTVVDVIVTLSLFLWSAHGMCTSSVPLRLSQVVSSAVAIPVGGLYVSLAYTLLKNGDQEAIVDREGHQKLFSSYIHPGDRVLEVGIGSGLSKNEEYYPKDVMLTGIDVTAGAAITESTAKSHDYTPILGNAEEMSMFADGQFDAVVSTFSMCTIPHPDKALREISRTLKKGGDFIAIEHVLAGVHKDRDREKEGLLGALGFGLREQQELLDPLQQRAANGCHLTRQTDALLKQMAASQYFSSVESLEYIDFTTKWPINSQVFAVLRK